MKTKPRGLRRKCQSMVAQLTEQTRTFPNSHSASDYWHLHLPVAQSFIDSKATPQSVRLLCIQTMIERAFHLSNITPIENKDTRVVVAVSLPNLWASQIIVFFGSDYFENFFERDTDAQRWSLLSNESLAKQYGLHLPEEFSERGFKQEVRDENGTHKGKLWFIGQLSKQ